MSFGDGKQCSYTVVTAAESRQVWEEGSTHLNEEISSHVVSISLIDSGCPDTYLNLPFPRKPKKELNNWRRIKTSQTEGQCNLDESTSLKPLSDWLIQYIVYLLI